MKMRKTILLIGLLLITMAHVLQAVENGDILSLDLQKIGGDEIINKKIDDTILKSLVLQGETHSKIETVQNIAKATYYEFK